MEVMAGARRRRTQPLLVEAVTVLRKIEEIEEQIESRLCSGLGQTRATLFLRGGTNRKYYLQRGLF